MRMEGRFVNRFAEDARSLILRSGVPPRLVVNLSEVTFVDTVGEDVLLWLNQVGVQFIAKSFYSISLCERLHLRTTQKNASFRDLDSEEDGASKDPPRRSRR